jgi:hypothetical protein
MLIIQGIDTELNHHNINWKMLSNGWTSNWKTLTAPMGNRSGSTEAVEKCENVPFSESRLSSRSNTSGAWFFQH